MSCAVCQRVRGWLPEHLRLALAPLKRPAFTIDESTGIITLAPGSTFAETPPRDDDEGDEDEEATA